MILNIIIYNIKYTIYRIESEKLERYQWIPKNSKKCTLGVRLC